MGFLQAETELSHMLGLSLLIMNNDKETETSVMQVRAKMEKSFPASVSENH